MRRVKYKVFMVWVEAKQEWNMNYKRPPNDFIMHFKADKHITDFFGELNKKYKYEYQVVTRDWKGGEQDGQSVLLRYVHPVGWYMLEYASQDVICVYPDCKNVKIFFGLHRSEDKDRDHYRIVELTRIKKWLNK